MSSTELPEHQIFHILRNGEQEPIGPYSQNEVISLVNQQQISPSDFVFYPELDGWKSISQVFDIHAEGSNFCDEGQNPHAVSECLNFINSRAEPGEEINYVAVQELPALSLTAAVRITLPKSMILTNRRLCILNPKMMGSIDFDEYPIDQISEGNKEVKSGKGLGVFSIVLKTGDSFELDKLPVDQLDRLEGLTASIINRV